MIVIDFIEIWWRSVSGLFESRGVAGQFERSPIDRLNPSCSLNLRRGELEIDLIVWESGEAELAIVESDGSVRQQHFDDLKEPTELESVLVKLSSLARM